MFSFPSNMLSAFPKLTFLPEFPSSLFYDFYLPMLICIPISMLE